MCSTSQALTSPWTEVLDVPVDLLDADDIRRWVTHQLENGTSCAHVVTLNPEYVMSARRNASYAAALRKAELSTVDGVGISLALRLLGTGGQAERITGVALCWMLTEIAAQTGDGIFLLGAGPGIANAAGKELVASSPGTIIAGTWAEGSPKPGDDGQTIQHIADSGATILLVAYGAPAQIHWITRNQDALSNAGVKLASGIGGALDYISGDAPWAPPILRKLGLEWAYRLAREPWRWRRQLVLPQFLFLVVREAARQRKRSFRLRARASSGAGVE